jgi:hypothetical protein
MPITSEFHYTVEKWQRQGGRILALFFVYAAQFLEALSSETGPLSSLGPDRIPFEKHDIGRINLLAPTWTS